MDGGFVKIDRKIVDWEWFHNVNTCHLFFYCIISANWKDGRFEGVEVPRGSFVSSFRRLSRETGLTFSEVKRALGHLERTQEVTHVSYPKFSVFTVKNYHRYQLSDTVGDTRRTHDGHTTDTRRATIEEIKRNKEGNKQIDSNESICSEQETSSEQNTLPLSGGRIFRVEQQDIDRWKEIYPSVDVERELMRMDEWFKSNQRRRKRNPDGLRRFINHWLFDEQSKVKKSKSNELEEWANG